ncbi:hypothetical protein COCOBI_18-3030 [Coccomyxa sp. Obi]|nr:hypothetical protein COCOBI_18-3030 [Coccomyxa sp. Obi]
MYDDARMLAVQAASCELDWDHDIAHAGNVLQVYQLIFGCGVPGRNGRGDGVVNHTAGAACLLHRLFHHASILPS